MGTLRGGVTSSGLMIFVTSLMTLFQLRRVSSLRKTWISYSITVVKEMMATIPILLTRIPQVLNRANQVSTAQDHMIPLIKEQDEASQVNTAQRHMILLDKDQGKANQASTAQDHVILLIKDQGKANQVSMVQLAQDQGKANQANTVQRHMILPDQDQDQGKANQVSTAQGHVTLLIKDLDKAIQASTARLGKLLFSLNLSSLRMEFLLLENLSSGHLCRMATRVICLEVEVLVGF